MYWSSTFCISKLPEAEESAWLGVICWIHAKCNMTMTLHACIVLKAERRHYAGKRAADCAISSPFLWVPPKIASKHESAIRCRRAVAFSKYHLGSTARDNWGCFFAVVHRITYQISFSTTGFSSEIRTKLRDRAVWQARAGCYSQAALSSNDSKTLYSGSQPAKGISK